MPARSIEPEESGIEERASFDLIRYANCWEDADVLCEALAVGPGARVLSIGSAGDNSLALLAEGADVVVADLSMAQLACLELRRAAFRRLDYEEVLSFLGVRDGENRMATFDRLEDDLSQSARQYWTTQRERLESGLIHLGKFESYFRLFRTRVLPLIHSRKTVDRLLAPKDEAERRRFYGRKWNNLRWRLLFRMFFSRFAMGRLGRDPEFFRYVEGSVADRILERTKYALTSLATHNNPYLDYILTGNFSHSLPRYLQATQFDKIRNGLDRLTLFHGPIDEAGRVHQAGGFDGFNLSDIFEYLNAAKSSALYTSLLSLANPRARLAYWNTFVPRKCPAELSHRVKPLRDLSESLFARDRAFFYSALWIDEVIDD